MDGLREFFFIVTHRKMGLVLPSGAIPTTKTFASVARCPELKNNNFCLTDILFSLKVPGWLAGTILQ